MSEHRIGLGIDLHRYVDAGSEGSNEQLVLGGVAFPDERPLEGHSDADAIAHAVCDAMLGAAGLGDLGVHFPDDDPAYRGASSLSILEECAKLIANERWHLVNADCTLVAERPKVAPVRSEMIERLSKAAGGLVHVKATRPEGLGSLGRLEGVGCLAVVLLER